MANYFTPLAAPEVRNALVDFSPVNNALDTNAINNFRQQQVGLQQQASNRADQELALNKQTTASALKTQAAQYEDLMHGILAKTAEGALSLPPDARATVAGGIISGHPEMADKLVQYGVDPKSPDGVLNFFANYGQHPLDLQAKKAKIAETNANTAKANMEARMAGAQYNLIKDPSKLFAIPGQTPAAGGNALSASNDSAGATSVPNGIPGIAVSQANPAIAPAINAQGLPTAPPAGARTPASGAIMPSMQTNPSYFSPEDMAMARMALIAPRAVAAIENTPGHQQRVAQAQTVGKDLGGLEERQRAGGFLLKGLNDLKNYIANADDDVVAHGMGPFAYSKTRPTAVAPFSYSAWTAPTPDKYEDYPTRAAAEATYNPTPKNKAYFDFQNGLNHLVDGLTEQFVAGAAKGGVQMSDSRQKVFTETMGALRNSTSKAEALKIAEKAQKIIAGSFNLPDGYSYVGPHSGGGQ